MVVGEVTVTSIVVSLSLISVTFIILCLVIVLTVEIVLVTVTGITETNVSVLRRIVEEVETVVKVIVLSLKTGLLEIEIDITVSDCVMIDVFGLLLLVIVSVINFVTGILRFLTSVDVIV